MKKVQFTPIPLTVDPQKGQEPLDAIDQESTPFSRF